MKQRKARTLIWWHKKNPISYTNRFYFLDAIASQEMVSMVVTRSVTDLKFLPLLPIGQLGLGKGGSREVHYGNVGSGLVHEGP